MAVTSTSSASAMRPGMIQVVALIAVALIPWPQGWAGVRRIVESARSTELNRSERERHATGYYEGLIGGGEGPEGARGELALKLMGKPNGWVLFNDAKVSRPLPGEFIQFELRPKIRRNLFGQPFVTNAHGMHSPEVTVEKPAKTFRIAILGASMDMGWGVRYEDGYCHRLEEWLNHHAARQGIASDRKFEVLNFAVAAYSPLQRLENLRRKVLAFRPDMVVFSATMLDVRLTEIHLCDLFRTQTDLTYDFLRSMLSEIGIGEDQLRVDDKGRLVHKEEVKDKLQPHYWRLYDETMGALAGECRSAGVPLVIVIIPRVGRSDAPSARAEPVARLEAIAAHHALPLYDLSASFDGVDPVRLEIAAWDDHPNALGHERLFVTLARALVKDWPRYSLLFPNAEPYHGDPDFAAARASLGVARRDHPGSAADQARH